MPPSPSRSIRRYRPLRIWPTAATLGEVQRLQVAAEFRAGVVARERQLDRRLEPAHDRAGVVAPALELVRIDILVGDQRLDRVGQLDLTARAALGLLELLEDLRGQHVTTDDGEV